MRYSSWTELGAALAQEVERVIHLPEGRRFDPRQVPSGKTPNGCVRIVCDGKSERMSGHYMIL